MCSAQAKSALWTAILQPQEAADEVERFHDAPDPDAVAPAEAATLPPGQPAAAQPSHHQVCRAQFLYSVIVV